MSKRNLNNNFIPRLNPRELDASIIRNWISIQSSALKHTIKLVEANIDSIYLYNPNSEKKGGRKRPIRNVIKSYLNKTSDPIDETKQIKDELEKLGLLIPISDIKTIHPKDLDHGINIIAQLTSDFSFLEFIDYLREVQRDDTPDILPLPIEGVLFLLEKHINLTLHSDSLTGSVAHIEDWFSHYLPYNSEQLSVSQFLSWICQVFDSVITNDVIQKSKEEYPQSAALLVLKYQEDFVSELTAVKTERKKKFYFKTFPEFKIDLNNLLLDNYQNLFAINTIKWLKKSKNEQFKHLVDKAYGEDSFVEKIGKLFSKKAVIQAVKSIVYRENSIHQLSLFSNVDQRLSEDVKLLDDMTDYDLSALSTYGKSLMAENEEFSKEVKLITDSFIISLADTFSKPFMYWFEEEEKFYPMVNLANSKTTDDTIQFLKAQREHEKAEAELLRTYINSLKQIQTRTSLNNLLNAVPKFFYRSNQKRWNLAIVEAEEAIRSREAFRKQKMRELGIDMMKNFTDAQKEVYLTEMLKVEEEIQQFVPFVTSSFQSALPSKKTVEFDSFRHQSDGVEFDPETVHDPDKWIRGNVMKTLKYKIKKGEVTQVNCFCLDLSGSMDHDRMRNLYKMLYLLVTGLQSRKSYDAFHFFSNTFIPGVDFTDEFTKKSLLFRVLTIVSRIDGPRIIYEGLEGTNISDGIDGCTDRMQYFISTLKDKKPGINLSCSMFVITDGEPSLGIVNRKKLNEFIEQRRIDTNYAIKAIYIKSQEDKHNFITTIFGEGNAVETVSFEEGVQKFTNIMTKTYKEQRQSFKWEQKRKKLEGKI